MLVLPPLERATGSEPTAAATATQILAWQALGFGAARINLRVPEGMERAEAAGAMPEVVALVHHG